MYTLFLLAHRHMWLIQRNLLLTYSERPLLWETTCLDRPQICGRKTYISIQLNLSLKTTCLDRPHFSGQWGGLSRQVLLYCTVENPKLKTTLEIKTTTELRSFVGCPKISAILYYLIIFELPIMVWHSLWSILKTQCLTNKHDKRHLKILFYGKITASICSLVFFVLHLVIAKLFKYWVIDHRLAVFGEKFVKSELSNH